MIELSVDALRIEKILRECGAMLIECLAAGKTEGDWHGDQFKAAADLIAHNFLMMALKTYYPHIPVVSEEDPVIAENYFQDHFIIDPIDGTASYAHGFPGWVTQIAYVQGGVTTLAGIYAPVNDEYFSAIKSVGSFCNGNRLRLVGSDAQLRTLIDNYPEARGVTRELMKYLSMEKYVESGSIALKICRIADQSADLFFKDMSPYDWDVAAPMLVLAEAGGVITDAFGSDLVLGRSGRRHKGLVVAANRANVDRVLNWLASGK